MWLTQAQLVEIYQSSKSNISEHLKHIFADKELDEKVVVRKFRTTTQHGAIEGKMQLTRNTCQFVKRAEFQALEQNQDFFSMLLSNPEIKKQVLGVFVTEVYNEQSPGAG